MPNSGIKEIERKWLMPMFPDLPFSKNWKIEQVYVYTDLGVEVRVSRRVNLDDPWETKYKLTLKIGNGLSRTEVESLITYKEFLKYQQAAGDLEPISKHYREFELPDGSILAASIVDGTWGYAEVEFNSEEEALAYQLPFDWEEVTHKPEFAMKNYWRRKNGIK